MPNPTPSPVRVAAVRAAAKAACFGGIRGDQCDQCLTASQCISWADWEPGTIAALAAYERAMGRTIDAEQIERMR